MSGDDKSPPMKRYRVYETGDGVDVRAHPEGAYVLYAAYERLERELAKAREDRDEMALFAEAQERRSATRESVLEEAAQKVEALTFDANDSWECSRGRVLADEIRSLKGKSYVSPPSQEKA